MAAHDTRPQLVAAHDSSRWQAVVDQSLKAQDPVQRRMSDISNITMSFDVERRTYYHNAMRSIEARLAAGRVSETEAMQLLQHLEREVSLEAQ